MKNIIQFLACCALISSTVLMAPPAKRTPLEIAKADVAAAKTAPAYAQAYKNLAVAYSNLALAGDTLKVIEENTKLARDAADNASRSARTAGSKPAATAATAAVAAAGIAEKFLAEKRSGAPVGGKGSAAPVDTRKQMNHLAESLGALKAKFPAKK